MHIDLSSAVWLDPLVIAFIVGALYPIWKDVIAKLRSKSRVAHKHLAERNDRLDAMLLDWSGEPAREGVPQRLGVMSRLNKIEGHLNTIDHEVTLNGGGSIKDAVTRTEKAVRSLRSDFDAHILKGG